MKFPVGSAVVFSHPMSKPTKRPLTGKVTAHAPAEEGFGAGALVFWPKLKHKGVLGVTTFHEFGVPWLKAA